MSTANNLSWDSTAYSANLFGVKRAFSKKTTIEKKSPHAPSTVNPAITREKNRLAPQYRRTKKTIHKKSLSANLIDCAHDVASKLPRINNAVARVIIRATINVVVLFTVMYYPIAC